MIAVRKNDKIKRIAEAIMKSKPAIQQQVAGPTVERPSVGGPAEQSVNEMMQGLPQASLVKAKKAKTGPRY